MPRKGENITKRKDGRWEARIIKGCDCNGKAQYAYLYAKSYLEVKHKKTELFIINPNQEKEYREHIAEINYSVIFVISTEQIQNINFISIQKDD